MIDSGSSLHFAYLRHLALALAVVLGLVAGFNGFMDPYDVFGAPRIKGLNEYKQGSRENARIAKVYMVERIKPKTLILGSSRTEMALDPEHPALTRQPAFNLSVEGANIYEISRLLQHALAVAPVEEVYIGLDYFAFHKNQVPGRGFQESRLAVQPDGHPTAQRYSDVLPSLFSASALNLSWKTLTMRFKPPTYAINGLGFRQVLDDNRDVLAKGGHRLAFLAGEASNARGAYDPHPAGDDVGARMPEGAEWLQKILAVSRAHGVRFHILLYPKHLRLQELIRAKGSWSNYMAWKRSVTAMVDAEAHRSGWPQAPCLWDFSAMSEINMEEVPPAGDVTTQMRWYRESSHGTKALGDLMLNRVAGTLPADRFPPHFGVLLTPPILEKELARQTAALASWRTAHPQDVAEIAATLHQAGVAVH